MRLKGRLVAVACAAACFSCSTNKPAPTPASQPPRVTSHDDEYWPDQVADCVLAEWKQNRSYYALLEIVDHELEPTSHPGVTTAMVRARLGEPTCVGADCYPNFTEHDWYYDTNMKRPIFHQIAFFHFSSQGVLQSVEYAGE